MADRAWKLRAVFVEALHTRVMKVADGFHFVAGKGAPDNRDAEQ